MYYILSSSTISHQNTFSKKGFSENIAALSSLSELIQPNYKEYIDSVLLRRMSNVIRMSVYCSLDCIKKSDTKQPEAIIVGTGLGCLSDTENFLRNIIASKDSLISPTSFIQSTHNTIAGQLSIILKNHNYNMTHTQNSLSFEHALQDGLLCLDEGKEFVLAGGADECTKTLDTISKNLNYHLPLTSGASFFMLSRRRSNKTTVGIAATITYSGVSSITPLIKTFLIQNNIQSNTVDLILYSSLDDRVNNSLDLLFKNALRCEYQKYCGVYFSNSAFAVHLAIDILEQGKVKFEFMKSHTDIKRILICNNLHTTNLGITLIETVEA